MTLEEAIGELEEMDAQFVHSKPGPFAEIIEAMKEVRDQRDKMQIALVKLAGRRVSDLDAVAEAWKQKKMETRVVCEECGEPMMPVILPESETALCEKCGGSRI